MERHRKTASLLSNAIGWLCIWGVCISCATAPVGTPANQQDLLFAEHSAMKKRLPLVERENDVLAKENSHYRNWVRELESNIKNLTTELADTKETYEQTLADKSEQIKNLELSLQQLDEEKTEHIASLNNAMVLQEKTFSAERERILKEKQEKETLLSSELLDKNKQLEDKALQIKTLASSKADLEMVLQSKAQEISKLETTQKDLEKALQNEKQQLSELAAVNKRNLEKLKDATEVISSLKKDRDKSMAELESAKAANADMAKSFNELFNQLQLKKDQSGTKI